MSNDIESDLIGAGGNVMVSLGDDARSYRDRCFDEWWNLVEPELRNILGFPPGPPVTNDTL